MSFHICMGQHLKGLLDLEYDIHSGLNPHTLSFGGELVLEHASLGVSCFEVQEFSKNLVILDCFGFLYAYFGTRVQSSQHL